MQEQPIPADNGGRACERCRFSDVVAIDPNTLKKVRVCRRFPPMPIISMQNGAPGMSMQFPNAQPMVWDTHWCYEFAPKLPDAINAEMTPKLIKN